ncbi:MAG TPA: exodeoxyribonuclease VII large subunit [Rheinheimera sp.]|nr:exodeoxyribonuclease VII large subunit [Rheinheimera sp.]
MYTEPTSQKSPEIYTVARLNAEVRLILELQFRSLWLCGEISNFVAASSGHWYFSLKDNEAQVKAAMFKQSNRNASFRPQNGQQVLVRARISVYEPRGEYQLLVDFIEPAGDGLLRQQYEQLKAKLASEGLFAPERKKPLPSSIRRVGVITSPTGAAVRDIVTVLNRRAPAIEIIIYPALVQGMQAPHDLIASLSHAIRRHEVDVLIIGRGGGSLEDLACFNDEQLARQIAACPLPIVSAVGHEIDFTIADFVADVRAPTPSAAAELVSPDQQAQLGVVLSLHERLQRAMRMQQGRAAQRFVQLVERLKRQEPSRKLQQQQQRLDELQQRLTLAMQRRLQLSTLTQQSLQQRLQQASPALTITRWREREQFASAQLQQAMLRLLQRKRQQAQQHAALLHQVSPLATLQRGYGLVWQADGRAVHSVSQVAVNATIDVQLRDGHVSATVTAVHPKTE